MFIYHLTHFGDVILMVYTHIVSGDYACNYGNITKCLGRPDHVCSSETVLINYYY